MLVFLTVAYFFFMATEVVFVDTSSRILEIVEVHSGILVDLLVVLVLMFDAVAPSSPVEGLFIIVVLVGEMTWAEIRSRHG